MKKLLFLLVALAPAAAFAQDPLVAGVTKIGTHPSYSSSYSGFWRGNGDYSLLTDGTNTFVNAPVAWGTIYFRTANNGDWMTVNRNTVQVNLPLYDASDLTVMGTAEFFKVPLFHSGMEVFQPQLGTWTATFGGGDYGLMTSGTTYSLFCDGPVFANNTLDVRGQAYKPGGGSWAASSDIRVKKDVGDFTPGLSALAEVRPVRYKYNGLGGTNDTGQEYVGVIAQELEKVLPFMVSSKPKKLRESDGETTDIKQVDPSAFTYVLINAVHELADQHRELKKLVCLDHPGDPLCRSTKLTTRAAERP